MSNNGPYVDIDDQEYRHGPVTPRCKLCGMPETLCDCAPSWHREPQSETSIIGWWPTAIFAVAALALAVLWVRL